MMDTATTSRWLNWTGPLFFLLFAVGVFVLEGDSSPGEKASGAEVVTFFKAHQGRGLISVFASPLLALLLVLFFSRIRALARATDGTHSGPTVMAGGAVLWAAGLLLGSTITLGLLSASHHNQEQVAQTMNVLNQVSWVPFIAGIAVTLIGAGMTVLRSGVLPSWLGWVALVVGAIALCGPGGFLGFFVAPVWMLLAGILLSRAPAPAATVSA